MSDINEKLAALRAAYPNDLAAIDAEQERVSNLLRQREFASEPVTQQLIGLCRRDIVSARLKLSSERNLTDDQRAALWHIVDARAWFLQMVVKDYDAELSNIESDLEAELNR